MAASVPVKVLASATCLRHDTPDGSRHVERPDRLRAARRGLEAWDGEITWEEPPPSKRDWLAQVHSIDHIRDVEQRCGTGGWFDQDTYAVPESWDAALLAAGGAVQAALWAADGQPAFCLTRPPGHHATPTRPMGFCLFNNVAVAAHRLTQLGVQVAIVDVDVHHGNGTQDIFYQRSDVLYVSLHQSPLYPGTGQAHEVGQEEGRGYTVNLPVPPGTGHTGWLELVDRVVLPVLGSFDPGVVLLSAGYDAHHKDPLGGLELSSATFHGVTQRLMDRPWGVACVLEGGYALEALEACVPATVAALAGREDPAGEAAREGVRPWGMLRSSLENHLAERWELDL